MGPIRTAAGRPQPSGHPPRPLTWAPGKEDKALGGDVPPAEAARSSGTSLGNTPNLGEIPGKDAAQATVFSLQAFPTDCVIRSKGALAAALG